jgi:hypothetical protein
LSQQLRETHFIPAPKTPKKDAPAVRSDRKGKIAKVSKLFSAVSHSRVQHNKLEDPNFVAADDISLFEKYLSHISLMFLLFIFTECIACFS